MVIARENEGVEGRQSPQAVGGRNGRFYVSRACSRSFAEPPQRFFPGCFGMSSPSRIPACCGHSLLPFHPQRPRPFLFGRFESYQIRACI